MMDLTVGQDLRTLWQYYGWITMGGGVKKCIDYKLQLKTLIPELFEADTKSLKITKRNALIHKN